MNVSETGSESKLKMNNLCFTNLHFTRVEDDIKDLTLKLKITRNMAQIDSTMYKVTLSVDLFDDDNKLNAGLTAVGVFTFEEAAELNHDKAKRIIQVNTVAIMFPYVRSQLSLLTTQPNLTPIILSSMNINALLEDQDDEL